MPWKPETIKRRAEQKARWAALPTVRCICGAVWRGRYAENNKVIDAHRARPSCHVTVESEAEQAK